MTADRDVRDSLDWEVEAEKYKTDAEFWKHNAELRASEIARLTSDRDAARVAIVDARALALRQFGPGERLSQAVQSLNLIAERCRAALSPTESPRP
jgi:hypothetical protein